MSNTYVRFIDVVTGNIHHGVWLPIEHVFGFRSGDILNFSGDRYELLKKEFEIDTKEAVSHEGGEIDVKLYVKRTEC
jgi:hypothetical protein